VLEVSKDNYCLVALNIVSSITWRFSRESVFYTDGSRTAYMTGFGVFHFNDFEMDSESGRAKWSLHVRNNCHSLCFRAHLLSFIGIQGNEQADALAKSAAIEDVYLQGSLISSNFIPLARSRIQNEWQEKWDWSEMGRFAYSILPSVQEKSWFVSFEAEQHVITKINRLISNHTCLRTHLNRIGIVDNRICECGEDYDTVDHLLWSCVRFREQLHNLLTKLNLLGTPAFVPVRDLLGSHHWMGMRECCLFLKECGVNI
jgi:hypothetical protein